MILDPARPEHFRDIVASRFGLWFEDARLEFLGDVLRRRAENRGTGIAEYLTDIEYNAASDESGPLADELTIGETYFFRNTEQFQALSEVVLPERMEARSATRTLSLLSAGCSSGEEPFTLAMLAMAMDAFPPWDISIRAVDLNPAALRKAASGRFGKWALRETPPAMQDRWFSRQGDQMVLSDDIRNLVTFDHRNLADPDSDIWQRGAYDVIFCRNVIMYFTPQAQQEVIARIADSLAPGGYLFLGHAETLRGLSQAFHLLHSHDTFYYRRKAAGEAATHAGPPMTMARTSRPLTSASSPWYAAIGDSHRRVSELALPAKAAVLRPAPWSLRTALDLLERERFADALTLVHDLPPDAQTDPDVLLLRAVLCVQDGKLAAAAEACRVLLEQNDLNAGANYVLALCCESLGETEATLNHYDRAIHLDPLFAMPRLHRGMLARRSGDIQAARTDLRLAIDLLKREDPSRILFFGGGFSRAALSKLCESELRACEG